MEPLESIVAKIEGEWLFEMLSDDRIFSHFHPIVSANNPAEVFAYECLARATSEEGQFVNPGKMFEIARQTGMSFNLDRACRLAAIRGCVEHGLDKPIFVNFSPGTIYNPKHCLQTTMEAIMQANLSPEKIVFEVVESEEIADIDHLLGILNYYRENGFRVALDDLGAGYSSLNLLSKLRPDFIKLDMELIRGVDSEPYKSVITENILSMSQRLGVKTIAEGVETIGEFQWLQDKGTDYIQGFLFAKPAAPPEHVRIPEG
ncbi:EAL domain-containing protein [Pseudodesulfovibrio sp. zrk46]|uniref:EAL domain-containing protein n=1 Tax=Pseudodesulfovibrio sp. zrk46 TaxID=2725288 RepID=UPI001FFCD9DC|nr:EAL domain-containing protein [Pseudodesulfovibrio sp. zrk46]